MPKKLISDLVYGELFLFPFKEGAEEMLLVKRKDSNTGVGYELDLMRYPREKGFAKLVKMPYTPEGLEVEVIGTIDHLGVVHES